MTQRVINIGAAPDDHTGDPIRTSFDKTNQNFTELYSAPSGGIAAGITPTTGFNTQQMLVSDGSVIQPVQAGTTINLGDASYPVYMGAFNNTVGINPCITFSGSGYRTADAIAVWTGSYLGISMTGGDNPGVLHQQTFFGFSTDTNSISTSPDTAFTVIKNSVAGFRNLASPTSPESLRVYNTFSNYSNGEWAALDWQTVPGTLTIGAQANGTGVVRNVNIVGGTLTFNGSPLTAGVSKAGDTMTGPLVMPLGSATATSINFGTANNGIYASNTNNINFSFAGASRFTFSASALTAVQAFRGAAGTAAAPQYSFTASVSSGLYSTVANQISMSTNGAETMRWNADNSTTLLGPIVMRSYTFATLPAAATAGAGARAFITDCNATTFYTAAAGGGTNKVPVFSDGAAWRIG